jgi:hypothetical protein
MKTVLPIDGSNYSLSTLLYAIANSSDGDELMLLYAIDEVTEIAANIKEESVRNLTYDAERYAWMALDIFAEIIPTNLTCQKLAVCGRVPDVIVQYIQLLCPDRVIIGTKGKFYSHTGKGHQIRKLLGMDKQQKVCGSVCEYISKSLSNVVVVAN